MKNHIEIYVPKCPRTYEKHLLDLLKSSIPDNFTSTLTIFSVKTLEKLCQSCVMASTKNLTVDFPVSKIDEYFLYFSSSSLLLYF